MQGLGSFQVNALLSRPIVDVAFFALFLIPQLTTGVSRWVSRGKLMRGIRTLFVLGHLQPGTWNCSFADPLDQSWSPAFVHSTDSSDQHGVEGIGDLTRHRRRSAIGASIVLWFGTDRRSSFCDMLMLA
ncbi:hypothetical protein GE09DRAFT_560594 [Coniochaeta sp. 2T2.1]|nr:hypothetical protein GE09DRAFT_560594 [Coniochaeta sp. 2T2.1]